MHFEAMSEMFTTVWFVWIIWDNVLYIEKKKKLSSEIPRIEGCSVTRTFHTLSSDYTWACHNTTSLCDHILKGKQKTSLSLFFTIPKGQTQLSTLKSLFYSTKICFSWEQNHENFSTPSLLLPTPLPSCCSQHLCLDRIYTQTPKASSLPPSQAGGNTDFAQLGGLWSGGGAKKGAKQSW